MKRRVGFEVAVHQVDVKRQSVVFHSRCPIPVPVLFTEKRPLVSAGQCVGNVQAVENFPEVTVIRAHIRAGYNITKAFVELKDDGSIRKIEALGP